MLGALVGQVATPAKKIRINEVFLLSDVCANVRNRIPISVVFPPGTVRGFQYRVVIWECANAMADVRVWW